MLLLYKIKNLMFFLAWNLTRTLADNNPLNGQCLRILPMDLKGFLTTKRNASNHILELSGIEPEMLYWFARKYNFSYQLLNYIAPLQDDSSFRRGAINYTLNGEVDFLLGTLAPTAERYKKIDYTTFFINEPSGLLIPFPETVANIAAVIQPFTSKVWMCFITSLFIVSICLHAINRGECLIMKTLKTDTIKNCTITNKYRFVSFGRVVQYVVEVAVSRGARCFNNSFKIRAIGAVWCLACFILAQAYNVELISYIMAPNRKPIINSPYDIPKIPGLKLTVDRGYPIDAALMATKSGVFKDLADTLRTEPDLRCNATIDCLKKVQNGLHVYANGIPILRKIVDEDWIETGTCHYLIAKEPFDKVLPAAFGFPKGSRFTDSISKGILQLSEAGLLNHWMDESFEKRDRCLKKFNDKTPSSPRLTLQNMSSPFIVLVISYIIAMVAFIGETVGYSVFNKKTLIEPVAQTDVVAPLETITIQDLEETKNTPQEMKDFKQVLDEIKEQVAKQAD